MRIRTMVSSVVTVGGTLLGLWFGSATVPNSTEPATPANSITEVAPTPTAVPRSTEPAPSGGVMLQKDFPCHEDEVLAYHPRFGPDHVGCISLDEVRNTTW